MDLSVLGGMIWRGVDGHNDSAVTIRAFENGMAAYLMMLAESQSLKNADDLLRVMRGRRLTRQPQPLERRLWGTEARPFSSFPGKRAWPP